MHTYSIPLTDTLATAADSSPEAVAAAIQTPSWQQQLATANISAAALLERLQLPTELLNGMQAAQQSFQLRVPEPYLSRIRPGDVKDPLLLQILPQLQELDEVPGYISDPLGEAVANTQQGIIHKYHGRLLLVISGGCAINCRYCFRRHFPYQDNQIGRDEWQQVLSYLRQDTSLSEVILSGGDPLATTDKRLLGIIRDLESLPHIRRLRLHTRLPVVIPQRVTPELLHGLENTRLQTVLVNHINHANEIDDDVRAVMAALSATGTTLLNQTVLLRGVNDQADTLAELSEALFAEAVLPYYLHLLDPVAGASHFDVSEAEARRIVGKLCDRLPGYLVPKLVKEIAGASAKVPILPALSELGTPSAQP